MDPSTQEVKSVRFDTVLKQEFEQLHGAASADRASEAKITDADEKALVQRVHDLARKDDWGQSALCLSGGGIRSATFSLGVLQGLAKRNLLGRFHYLSTVSGGGYIGGWLSAWIAREKGGLAAVEASLATASTGSGAAPIRRLRAYSNYLSPVWGFSTDFVTLIATFLRNLVLHWSVLVPLLAAIVCLPRMHLALLRAGTENDAIAAACIGVAGLLVVLAIAYVSADLPGAPASRGAASTAKRNAIKNRFAGLCFLPVLLAALLLSWVGAWIAQRSPAWPWSYFALAGILVHTLGGALGWYCRRRRGVVRRARLWDLFFIIVSGAVAGWVLSLFAAQLDGLDLKAFDRAGLYATLSVPALLACFWIGATLYTGFARRVTSENDREWWARSGAWWLSASLAFLVAWTLIVYGPKWLFGTSWLAALSGSETLGGPKTLGALGGFLGILTSFIGYWSKKGAALKERAQGILTRLGLRLLDVASVAFIVILVCAVSILASWALTLSSPQLDARAQEIRAEMQREDAERQRLSQEQPDAKAATRTIRETADGKVFAHVMTHAEILPLALLCAALLVFAAVMASTIGANTFSLHSMYANRLVRAYLGASREHRNPHWFTGFDPNDDIHVKELLAGGNGKLFHVVNIALNLVRPSGERLEWQQRKAASFTASALHCGSAALGYVPSRDYSGSNGMALGRAIAISGAAASPSMGYHTSPVVAFVMAFFNVRLGWWLPNTGAAWRTKWRLGEPASGLGPIVSEALSRTTESTPFVYLSDGGHFENLGLYEMVRRRCHRIVVVDAGCDPGYDYEDLENAIRKIRVDLGISITFPRMSLPAAQPDGTAAPRAAFGTIHYADVDEDAPDGEIVYIKPTIAGDEPMDVARYAMTNNKPGRAFPHQPTSDQFFDEAQFESYRMLGYHTATSVFPASRAWPYSSVPSGIARHLPRGSSSDQQSRGGLPAPPPHAGDRSDTGLGGRIMGNVSEAFQTMSHGAALATAITIGGAVGVAGTLTLQPDTKVGIRAEDRQLTLAQGSVVGLRQDDRDLLRSAIASKTLDDALTRLNARLEELLRLMDKLAAASSKLDATLVDELRKLTDAVGRLVPASNLSVDLARVETQLKRLETVIGSSNTAASSTASAVGKLSGDIQVLSDRTVDLRASLGGVQVKEPLDKILVQLDRIYRELGDIKGNVQETAPRRNIRGLN